MFMRIINVLPCSFSNWGKIVVKDVSNFTRVSGCIYTMRECSRYSWYDIFYCYNGFNAFPCIFLIVQIRLKIFFYSNFVYFFSKGLILSFHDFCILNEVFWWSQIEIYFLLKLTFVKVSEGNAITDPQDISEHFNNFLLQ